MPPFAKENEAKGDMYKANLPRWRGTNLAKWIAAELPRIQATSKTGLESPPNEFERDV
jgi:hypothetical protein